MARRVTSSWRFYKRVVGLAIPCVVGIYKFQKPRRKEKQCSVNKDSG